MGEGPNVVHFTSTLRHKDDPQKPLDRTGAGAGPAEEAVRWRRSVGRQTEACFVLKV